MSIRTSNIYAMGLGINSSLAQKPSMIRHVMRQKSSPITKRHISIALKVFTKMAVSFYSTRSLFAPISTKLNFLENFSRAIAKAYEPMCFRSAKTLNPNLISVKQE